jgi:hypothetical protein
MAGRGDEDRRGVFVFWNYKNIVSQAAPVKNERTIGLH